MAYIALKFFIFFFSWKYSETFWSYLGPYVRKFVISLVAFCLTCSVVFLRNYSYYVYSAAMFVLPLFFSFFNSMCFQYVSFTFLENIKQFFLKFSCFILLLDTWISFEWFCYALDSLIELLFGFIDGRPLTPPHLPAASGWADLFLWRSGT